MKNTRKMKYIENHFKPTPLRGRLVWTALALFTLAALIISGCNKDTTVYIPLTPPTINKTVLFSTDLVPLFKTNCALANCHASGGHVPNLESDNAYASLTTGNYISKTSPENSIIYLRLTGKLTPSMPMGAAPNPSNIEGLILAWIKQGAKKN
jgi:hypothetical protein